MQFFAKSNPWLTNAANASGFTISAQTLVCALYRPLYLVDTALTCPDLQSFRIPPVSSHRRAHYLDFVALTCPDLQSASQATILRRAGHCAHAVSVGCREHSPDAMHGKNVGNLLEPLDPPWF
ncbi:MAG: hypothetical protein K0B14_16820 [Anaerolineaceae bacterium]|nr:hypothetical protein [Anaerolineaceae bacterium]